MGRFRLGVTCGTNRLCAGLTCLLSSFAEALEDSSLSTLSAEQFVKDFGSVKGADAVRAADLVLIPAKPGPFDVWAASDIVDAVKARQEASAGKPLAAFVVTMARPRTTLSGQVHAALEDYGLPALAARTTERISYPRAAAEGQSVLEGRDRTAQAEILAIKDEIERLFDDTEP